VHLTTGYTLIEEKNIKEINSLARLFRHDRTGARILSLTNEDENKVFGVNFRTPPSDNTGVAHILEHSVLCGSRKYKVKEPFVELLKSSLQTFLNAMTFPDKTCYPVASQNRQDLYNLMDVYLDAVFFPNLSREVFAQEGWHLELKKPDAPLKFKGVVYNEMKGAYSSPDSLLADYSQQSIFPEATYGLDSGGSPEAIPDLTYEDFIEFHRRYYHPSNAWIFFYGDDPEPERLEKLAEYLDLFEPLNVESEIRAQPMQKLGQKHEHGYSADPESDARYYLTINWLLPETCDARLNLGLRILDFILTGMPGSPLRQRLIESGLGEDLAGAGLETDILQMYYSTGMRGIASKNLDRVEELIHETLQDLARNGIDPEIVRAALSSVEFALRENNTGSFPRGLAVMFRALSTWLYDKSPFVLLEFSETLKELDHQVKQGKNIFEDLIQKHFLDNNHRTVVVLKPDPQMDQKIQEMENRRLEEIKNKFDRKNYQELISETHKLLRWQEEPDDAKELARIPRLSRQDLEPKVRIIQRQEQKIQGLSLFLHPQPTAGIFYLDLGLDLHFLPQKYLGYIPLFGRALLEMGTDKEDYVRLSTRIRRHTGGIAPVTFTHSILGETGSTSRLFLRGKSLPDKIPDMLRILKDIITQADLKNKERFRQLVLEEKAGMEQALIPAGHRFVAMRLKARYSEADWVQEHMSGVSYLLFLRHLLQRVEDNWDLVQKDLEDIKYLLMNKQSVILNVTAEEELIKKSLDDLEDLAGIFPEPETSRITWKWCCVPGNEAMYIPARVNYVGRAVNLDAGRYSFHGASLAATRLLRAGWLWDKIRVQGGAYGAFGSYDHFCNVMAFASYRDPNIADTLDVFAGSGEYLARPEQDLEEVEKAVIGAIGEMDSYQLPDAKGFSSMIRLLTNISDEYRQKIRDEILSTGLEDFQAFGRSLSTAFKQDKGVICILGSKEHIEQYQEQFELENKFRLL